MSVESTNAHTNLILGSQQSNSSLGEAKAADDAVIHWKSCEQEDNDLDEELEDAAMTGAGSGKKEMVEEVYFSLIKNDFVNCRENNARMLPQEVIAICADMYRLTTFFRFGGEAQQQARDEMPQTFVDDCVRLLNAVDHFNVDDDTMKFALWLIGFSRKMISIFLRLRSLRRHWEPIHHHVKEERELQELAPDCNSVSVAASATASSGDAASTASTSGAEPSAGDKKQFGVGGHGVAAKTCACLPSTAAAVGNASPCEFKCESSVQLSSNYVCDSNYPDALVDKYASCVGR